MAKNMCSSSPKDMFVMIRRSDEALTRRRRPLPLIQQLFIYQHGALNRLVHVSSERIKINE